MLYACLFNLGLNTFIKYRSFNFLTEALSVCLLYNGNILNIKRLSFVLS